MSGRSLRGGVLPRYFGSRGDVNETQPETEGGILAAMGVAGDHRPRAGRGAIPEGKCEPPPSRAWGWAVQIYAARSSESWGIGDLADLRRLGRMARSQGASVLLINPLGAQPPIAHQEPCPYYASSRRFLNTLYLGVQEVPGAELCAADLQPLTNKAPALPPPRPLDHDPVFRLKSRALEAIFKGPPDPAAMQSS